MEPFTILTGVAAALLQNDINTDQISPVLGHGLDPDYGKTLFQRWRFTEEGEEIADFVLNQPQFCDAKILVVGENFGCGSSRESAVWSLAGFGIRCVVARSLADIFRENCLKNGMLPLTLAPEQTTALENRVVAAEGGEPFTADLERQILSGPGGDDIPFEIAAGERQAVARGAG